MINNGNTDTAYNNGQDIPYMMTEVFDFLIQYGNEEFWKAIYYKDYDCLEKPNLTLKEKRKLIYTYGENINEFNIYLNSPLIMPEEDKAKVLLKAYKVRIKPENAMGFVVSFNFDILVHATLANIKKGDTMLSRADFIESQLILMLHCRDFSFGRMAFDRELSSDAQAYMAYNNSNNYFGEVLCMCVDNFRAIENEECG